MGELERLQRRRIKVVVFFLCRIRFFVYPMSYGFWKKIRNIKNSEEVTFVFLERNDTYNVMFKDIVSYLFISA